MVILEFSGAVLELGFQQISRINSGENDVSKNLHSNEVLNLNLFYLINKLMLKQFVVVIQNVRPL